MREYLSLRVHMYAGCDCVNMIVFGTHECMHLCVCVPPFAACQASLLPLVNKTCPSVASRLCCLSFFVCVCVSEASAFLH